MPTDVQRKEDSPSTPAESQKATRLVSRQLTLLYWSELATVEKALLAFEPISRMVPMTTTKMTASITAYSAMSCP